MIQVSANHIGIVLLYIYLHTVGFFWYDFFCQLDFPMPIQMI